MTPAPRRWRPASALRDFLATEAAGGYVLMAAALVALIVANSQLAPQYFNVLHIEIAELSLLHWINDGLMAIFFLLIGLEIKRELVDGELATNARRVLPGAAALAGMIVPALLYLALNHDVPAHRSGWAIPAATDIAFALGILMLLGSRVPASLKILLTAIAIIDDLGAIVIIAVAYTATINFAALGTAAAGVMALLLLNRLRVMALTPYLIIGVGVWAATLLSGVHATLAGVAVALTIPLKLAPGRPDDETSPLHRLEHALAPAVAFAIIPLFGFSNAGVSLRDLTLESMFAPVPLGIMLGLFVGKQLGIFGAIWMMVKLGLADMPAGASWRQIYGVAVLCGIGFTMSLFIAALAFGEGTAENDAAKIGILAGSLLSAFAGWALLARSQNNAPP
ncbi:MAG: Na+/H+ antiporter NhaA [Polymorphobacter sp.]